MSWLKGFNKKQTAAKGFQNQKSSQALQLQTFILEPILTPSGILDTDDHSHDPVLDLDTPVLPEDIDLAENELPDVDDTSDVATSLENDYIADEIDVTDIADTHRIDESISDQDFEEISFFQPIDSVDTDAESVDEGITIQPLAIDETDDGDVLATDNIDQVENLDLVSDGDEVSDSLKRDELEIENESDGEIDPEDRVSAEIAIASFTSQDSTTDTDVESPEISDINDTEIESSETVADLNNTEIKPPETSDINDTEIESPETIADLNNTDIKPPETFDINDTDVEIDFDKSDDSDNTSNSPEVTDIPEIIDIPSTFTSGVFTVDETGIVGIDYLFDGGAYKGELAIFSLQDMENFTPGSSEFIKEAASRALSSSELGHVVISDITEGARFEGRLPGGGNENSGIYEGVKPFQMRPGDRFAVMLVPNGSVQQLLNNPNAGGALRPLFSLVTANPNEHFHIGQIADVTGEGNIFVMEDLRVDTKSDRDYNDIIFQVRGAAGKAIHLDEVIATGKDWRTSDMGQALIAYAEPYVTPDFTDYFEWPDGELAEIPFDGVDDFSEDGELVADGSVISEENVELIDDAIAPETNETTLISEVPVLGTPEVTENPIAPEIVAATSIAEVSVEATPKVLENTIAIDTSHPATATETVTKVSIVETPKVVENVIAIDTSHPATATEAVTKVSIVETPKVVENVIAIDTSHPATTTEAVTKIPIVEAPNEVESAVAHETTITNTVAKVPVVDAPEELETTIAQPTIGTTSVTEVTVVAPPNAVENAIAPDTTHPTTETEVVAKVTLVETAQVTESAIAPDTVHPTTVAETVVKVPAVETPKLTENAIAPDNTTVTESTTVAEATVVASPKVTENAIAPDNIPVTESTTVAEVTVVEAPKVVENAIAPNNTSTTPAPNVTTTVTSTPPVEKEVVVTTSPITINQSSTTPTSGVTSTTEVTVSTQTTVASPSSSTTIASNSQTVLTVEQPPVKVAIPKPPTTFDFPKANQPLVGVIDTGFSGNNPDFDYSQIKLGKDWVDGDDNPLLQSGEGSEHGTHVLGIIAAQKDNDIGIDGINDDAPVWVGRAIGSGKWAESLVEFVDAAKDSGQPNAVVNLSLDLTQINPDGSVTTRYEFTPQERAAIEYARQHNVLIVVAAGNDGGVMSALGQSSQEFDNIITVGAAERVNDSVAVSKAYDRASYSSYGYGLDIMADGGTVDNPVLSTTGDGVGTMAGTSVASAKVTGAVSQVWAANPKLSYRQVIEILKNTATDLKTPGWDAETGAGFLNMTAAVLLAKVTTPEKYDVLATVIPETWSGEGIVTPTERAAATEFMGKYYEWDSYTITSLDTLSAIALRTMGSSSATYYNFIAQKNSIANPNLIYPGQKILIPRQVSAPVQNQPAIPSWQQAIDQAYAASPVNLGSPLSGYLDATKSPQGTTGKYRVYQNGTIHWSPQHGAVPLWFDLQREYNEYSSPNGSGGWLGFPTKREYAWNGGMRTDFEGGYIFWNGQAKAYRSWESPNNSSNTNTSSSPPATPGQTRQYIVKSDDTLSGIALRELGNANRWREIKKPDGTTFTETEARLIKPGQSVYLPVTQQVGTGKPITSTPISTPVQNIILKPGASNLNFSRGQQWITSTGYKFIFQHDGNLVLYNPQGKPIWATGTEGTGADRFSVQADGNVVLYDRGKPVWASDTAGNRGASFAIQNDGNLVVYSSNGKALFDTGTYGGRTRTVTASPDWFKKHTPPSKPGYVNSNVGSNLLNLRSSPQTSPSTIIGKLSQGTSLTILEKVTGDSYGSRNDWYKVRVGDKVGYVAAYYVSEGSNNNNGGSNSSIDRFISWAMSQTKTITRHDRLSLGTWSDGECVTLIARYIQDVFMNPSERSKAGQAYSHGYATASTVSNLPYFGSYTTRAGLSSNPPRRGGVISFMGSGFDATYGHVGIVTRYDAATNRIYYIDIGKSQGGVVTGEKSISATSAAIRGWTNPK